MKALNNWNNIQPQNDGEVSRLTPGGYICVIKGVKDVPDKQYLEICLDIAHGEFEGYYQRLYKNFGGAWKGKINIFYDSSIQDYAESTQRKFKGFITSVEESNKGYKWNWMEQSLKGMYVGVLFGEEEYQKQDTGDIATVVKPRFFRSVEVIQKGAYEVPKVKKYKGNTNTSSGFNNAQNNQNAFGMTMDIASDTLPF